MDEPAISHSPAVEEIESLFIVQRFDEALAKCEQELRSLRRLAKTTSSNHPDKLSSSVLATSTSVSAAASQALDSAVFGFDATAKKPVIPTVGMPVSLQDGNAQSLGFSSTFDLITESLPLVQLMIQLLFETKRSNEIMPFVRDFYGDEVEGVPLDVVFMCVKLQISLHNYDKAGDMIRMALDRFTVTSLSPNIEELTEERYINFIEVKAIDILAATKEYITAESYIQNDLYLKDTTKVELITKVRQVQLAQELQERNQAAASSSPSSASAASSSSKSSPSGSPVGSPRLGSREPITPKTSFSSSNGSTGLSSPGILLRTESKNNILVVMYRQFQRKVLKRYMSLSDTQKKAMYGLIIMLALGTMYFLSRRLIRATDIAQQSAWSWFSRISNAANSLNGPQSQPAPVRRPQQQYNHPSQEFTNQPPTYRARSRL